MSALREQLRAFFTALMFLTRLPCPAWVGYEPELLARSTTYFPLVGVVVGLAGAAVYRAASLGWTAWVAAVLATASTVWLTGAFHEDALADACDGFGGGYDPARILAIMKDSRVGAYGAAALALALLAKVGTLASLDPALAGRALVAGHVLGRWSSLLLIRRYDYVRDTDAKSKPFAASVTRGRLAGGTIAAATVVVVALWGRWVLVTATLLATVVVTGAAGRYFHRRIGGITGDCLGAANQLVELVSYLVIAWRWPGGVGEL